MTSGRKREEEEAAAVPPSGRASAAQQPGSGDRAIATIQARALLGQSGIVRIEHEGQIYTLRLTRNDRLILTK